MTAALSVSGLCKTYPAFKLRDVSFEVMPGEIVGFIGRNGAGKTTTIKSILGLVHPDGGDVRFFGLDTASHEAEIRQRVGYAGGTIAYYPRKRIRDIVAVTKTFYDSWDDAVFERYLKQFGLDPEKAPRELSEGMKVKLNLAIALSHGAELLMLDEPTSGLDPASREDLLEVFLTLAREGTAILFSTHITSDLEKCADSVVLIQNGAIRDRGALEAFRAQYRLAHVGAAALTEEQRAACQGERLSRDGSTVLLRAEDAGLFADLGTTEPTLDEIVVHLEKEEVET